MRRSTLLSLTMVAALSGAGSASIAAVGDDSAAAVLQAARHALGGEEKLAAVKTLTVTGEQRRVFGEREISGDVTLDLMLPDRMRRTDESGIPGGPRMTRVSVLNGDEIWFDNTNRGGGGGFARFAGPNGAQGQGGRAMSDEDRERMRKAQAQRMKSELQRYQLAWLLASAQPIAHVATAEAEDGKADVLEVKDEEGRPVRLFIDQETHLPLMMTYDAAMPRMMRGRPGAGRPSPEEIERMRREPPQIVTFEVHYAEYKEVDGILLPHLITQSTNGNVTEEWTIERYRINPSLKVDEFEKSGSSN
jgi:outer membrane lipoprotein-sorting protein